jgi:integrase
MVFERLQGRGIQGKATAKMRGHIRERSPGHWAIVIDIRDPGTGKRKRKWHTFRGTKREAETKCSRLVALIDGDGYQEPTKVTLSQFLEQWLEAHRSQVAPRTFERYGQLVRTGIIPLLGNAVLSKLGPQQIAAAYAKALASGRRDGAGGLSPRTVVHMHRVLRQALQQAFEWGLLARNPAAQVRPPKVEKKSMNVLDPAQTAALLAHFRPTRTFIPVLLAALCGLRRGEVVALKWKHVDIANATMAVCESLEQTKAGIRRKETKGGRARSVAIPALVIPELRRHRARQIEELLRLGVGLDDEFPIVAKEDGGILQPNSLTHEFVRILALSESLPRIRFHDLRHGHATHMLASGVHPKIAQERLGHSTIAITLDLYSHVMPGMQEDAAAKVDAAMALAIEAEARIGPKKIG